MQSLLSTNTIWRKFVIILNSWLCLLYAKYMTIFEKVTNKSMQLSFKCYTITMFLIIFYRNNHLTKVKNLRKQKTKFKYWINCKKQRNLLGKVILTSWKSRKRCNRKYTLCYPSYLIICSKSLTITIIHTQKKNPSTQKMKDILKRYS